MQQAVTIIGLGAMGSTLARLYLARGARVTVWNRSPAAATAVVERGAVLAPSVAAAFAASPLTLICVSNDAAVTEILAAPGIDLAGRTLVQLTTIDPGTARAGEAWAHARGGAYLAGAIQAAPSQMGQPDTPILIAGAPAAWEAQREPLAVLGGGWVYLGADAGAAATMDLATLSWVYGGFLGFVHGAMIAQAEGLDVATYGQILRAIAPSFGAFFAHEGAVIQAGDFAVSESPLRISLDATRRLLDTATARGLSTELPGFLAAIFASASHLGDEEVAALIKVMRPAGARAA